MHQVATCPLFTFRILIPLKWSASTPFLKPPGPTSNLNSASFTFRRVMVSMVSSATMTIWRSEMATHQIHQCLEDSAVTSLMPQQTCNQEAIMCGWSRLQENMFSFIHIACFIFRFMTDDSVQYDGFKINYTAVTQPPTTAPPTTMRGEWLIPLP